MVITSRMTTRGRTTLPKAVRESLERSKGDTIAYRIEGERVVLTAGDRAGDVFMLFDEWGSAEDREAYRDL